MTDSNNKTDSEWKNRELGALWKKEGKKQSFYSGYIKVNKGTDQEQEVPLVIFVNKLKSSDRAPDLLIYESQDTKQKVASNHDDIPDSFIE